MQVIYTIRNITNQKFYVGSTTDSHVRFQNHRRLLRKGKHHCCHLQAAWIKYGEECFKFEVIEIIPDDQNLQAAEDVWLEKHHGQQYCYNTGRRSDAPWRGGKKENHPAFGHAKTPEAKAAISATLKAFFAADPANHPMRGKKHTPEALAKMALKKVYRGEEHYRYGQTLSDEVKAKIGATQRGVKKGPRTITVEGSQKIKAAMAAGHYKGHGHPMTGVQLAALRKPVIEISSGQEFESLTATLAHYELKMPTLLRALKTGKPLSKGPKMGLQFRYKFPSKVVEDGAYVAGQLASLEQYRCDILRNKDDRCNAKELRDHWVRYNELMAELKIPLDTKKQQ